jgi:hypothetical protein
LALVKFLGSFYISQLTDLIFANVEHAELDLLCGSCFIGKGPLFIRISVTLSFDKPITVNHMPVPAQMMRVVGLSYSSFPSLLGSCALDFFPLILLDSTHKSVAILGKDAELFVNQHQWVVTIAGYQNYLVVIEDACGLRVHHFYVSGYVVVEFSKAIILYLDAVHKNQKEGQKWQCR